MFFSRNLVKDFGIFPFMSLLIDLKASAVLLNLWKSSKVTLNKIRYVQFLQTINVVEVLLEVLNFLELLWLVTSEQGEPGSCFEKDQHFTFWFYYYNFETLFINLVKYN